MSAHIELTVRPYQIAPLSLLLGVKKPVQTGERESSGDIKIPEAPDLSQPPWRNKKEKFRYPLCIETYPLRPNSPPFSLHYWVQVTSL